MKIDIRKASRIRRVIEVYGCQDTFAQIEPIRDIAALLCLKVNTDVDQCIFQIQGKATIAQGIESGTLFIGREFINRCERLIRTFPRAYLGYIEYRFITAAGCLLPLILTDGGEAESLFSGLKMFGYDDMHSLELLANRDFAEYLINDFSYSDKNIQEYMHLLDRKYRVEYWDFLTGDEIESLMNIFKQKLALSLDFEKV